MKLSSNADVVDGGGWDGGGYDGAYGVRVGVAAVNDFGGGR